MYENLLLLPYFQGMSKDELTSILDKVKLEFINYAENEKILSQKEECSKFTILIQGCITIESNSPNNTYKITEELQAPYAIEPYSLFGSTPQYKRNYYAKSNCSILSINKQFFYSEFSKHHIFSINLLNLISRKIETTSQIIWNNTPQSIESRIIHFTALRSELQTGCKTLTIKMEDLANLLQETRLNISRALNNLQNNGIAKLRRKEIFIPSFDKALEFVAHIKENK